MHGHDAFLKHLMPETMMGKKESEQLNATSSAQKNGMPA
jgi:hypothetical protein